MLTDNSTLIVVALAVVAFAVIIGIRWKYGQDYQITLTDLVLLLAPILIWLVVTNKLGELSLGAEGLTIKAAARQPVATRLSRISVQDVTTADKGSSDAIPALIERRVQALRLQINKRDYYDEGVLRTYLDELGQFSFFQYVVISDEQGRLVGAADARDLNASLKRGILSGTEFTAILNGRADVARLSKLPGFEPRSMAISETVGNGEALNRMDRANVPWLCVVRDDRFLGIVDRAHVTSSIVLDVVKQLEPAGGEQK
jgi:hypothetical protein